MNTTRDQLRRIAHDVGKYLARTARNLPPGPSPATLRAMLVADLYGGSAAQRPSALFESLSRGLDDAALDAARERLREIDALEDAVRRGDARAVERAAALAIDVDELLRARVAEIAR